MKTVRVKAFAGVAAVAFTAAFCLYYMDNGYFNTIMAKTRAFCISVIISAVLFLTAEITSRHCDGRWLVHYSDSVWRMINLFFVSYLVSSILSGDFVDALTGQVSWYTGLLSYFCGMMLYLMIRDLDPDRQICVRMITVISLPFFIIAVCHGSGIDVFYLHRNLISDEKYNYISTAGNIDVFAGITSLLVPLMASAYIEAAWHHRKMYLRILYIAAISAACASAGLSGSDSVYIGIAAALCILTVIACARRIPLLYINRIMESVSGGLVCAEAIQFSDRRAFPVTEYIGVALHKHGIALIFLAITLLIGIFLRITDHGFVPDFRCAIIIEGMFIAAAVIFSMKNITITPGFGSGRLRIWKKAMEVFMDGSLLRKLFGVGPALFGLYTGTLKIGGRVVTNAHNAFLEHLVCGGISTAVFYVATIITVLRKCIKERRFSPFFFGLCGYLMQSMLNNPHNLLTPFVSISLALL